MRIIYFLMLIMVLSIGSANAIAITGFKDIHAVGQAIPVATYTGTRDNIFYVADDTNITIYDTLGGATSTGQIRNFPADVTGVWGNQQYIYVVLYTGAAYRIDNSIGSRAFSTIVLTGDSRTGVYLGDFSTTDSYNHRIVTDESGNIYVYDASLGDIYKIDGTSLTSVTFYSGTNIRGGLFPGSDGLYYNDLPATTNCIVRRITDVETATNVKSITSGTTIYGPGISQLSNDNIIVYWMSNTVTYMNEYTSSGALVGSVFNGSSSYILSSTDSGNIFVCANGIIVLPTATTPANTITTFSTISGAGGYFTSESGLSQPQITYGTRSILSEYPIYYNVSAVTANFNIAIDETWYDNAILTYDPFTRYEWRVELWGPDGVSLSSYTIPEGNTWKRESYWLGIIGQGDMQTIGSVTYPQIAANGTYQLRLYELNTVQGTKALLDTYEFEVLDITNPASSGAVPVNNDASVAFTSFLGSPAFIGMILFVGIAVAVGKDRKGQIHGTGIIIGAVIGCIVLVMTGLFPVWTIYVIVLVSLVLLGKSMIGLGGG